MENYSLWGERRNADYIDERRAAGAVVLEAVYVNCLREVYYGEGTGRCKKGGRCGELFRVGDVDV